MKITGAHVSAARDLLKLTQQELGAITGVSWKTIMRFEKGEMTPKQANLEKIRVELERRGIEFLNGNGIGVRLDSKKAAEFSRLSAAERTAAAERNESNH